MKRLPALAALALGLTVVPAVAAHATTSTAHSTSAPATKKAPAPTFEFAKPSAAYLIAGMLYGDPDGNEKNNVVTITPSTIRHEKRVTKLAVTLTQLKNAVHNLGGTSTQVRNKVTFQLPATTTMSIDLGGSVTINGQDAFNLKQVDGVWTTTATPRQARAFLAGYIEGEGSTKGLVGDDPSAAHLELIAHLMATSAALDVPTQLVPNATGKFNRLYVSQPYWSRVQSYPFAQWVRCPGGAPAGES